MTTRFSKFSPYIALTATALAGSGLVGGCAENRASLFIAQAMYLDPEDSCAPDPDPSEAAIVGGIWDLGVGYPYVARLLIGNQLRPVGNNNQLRAETNRIQLQWAEVELSTLNGSAAAAPYRVPLSGTVSPDDSSDPGWISLPVQLIPSRNQLPGGTGDYMVSVRIVGTTLGGTTVESSPWDFPVQVCEGCLAKCPEDPSVSACVPGSDFRTECNFYRGTPPSFCESC